MAVLFLRQLLIQGLVGRTWQCKQLCWTTWKECTSYVNHRKKFSQLGQLWYHMFLIGFRVLASQVLYSALLPCQPCTGVPTRSPCTSAVAASRVYVGGDPHTPCTTAPTGSRELGHCLHSNSLPALEKSNASPMAVGTSWEMEQIKWQTNVCRKTPTDQHQNK